MSNHPKRVLVVEDEQEIRELIALHLRREGYLVDDLSSGDAARTQLSRQDYDMVLLDWMLPGLSGLELTRWMRAAHTHVPDPSRCSPQERGERRGEHMQIYLKHEFI